MITRSHPLLDRHPGVRARSGPPVAGVWRRVPQRALVEFARSFAVMVQARLPLLQALDTAAGQCRNARLRQVLVRVRGEVQRGRSLADSLAAHPAVFDRLFVHLARVGEAAGVLDQVLLRLATYLEKTAALRRKVQTAMAYPALVLVVAAAATTFLLTQIVPTFAEMYADFGAELPAPTQFILHVSRGMTEHVVLAVLVIAGSLGLMAGVRRTERGRLWLDRMVLRVPFAGSLLLKHSVARFCRTLGTLLASGVALVEALDLLSRMTGNRVVEQEVKKLLASVRRGSSLVRPLQEARLFPGMVVHMIAVGEETAELDRMLVHVADHYEREVDLAVEGLTAVVEPVLIVLVGIVLGGVLAALYLPIFDLVSVVG